MILPWHAADWDRITDSSRNKHHGLLVTAQPGTGLREFAVELSRFWLCDNPNLLESDYCGNCQSCRLFEAGTHPDFNAVISEYEAVNGRIELLSSFSDRFLDSKDRAKKAKPSRVIAVDQIRKLISTFSNHSHISESRVCLVMPADRLNTNAANALLKLLEEPPSNSIFILATAEPGRLPKTILSRCVMCALTNPTASESLEWLQAELPTSAVESALELSGYQPINARTMIESGELEERQNYLGGLIRTLENKVYPLDLAQKAAKMEFDSILVWFQQFIRDLVNWKSTGSAPFWISTSSLNESSISLDRLYLLYDRITHYRRISRGSVNEQLAMEDLLISLQRVVA